MTTLGWTCALVWHVQPRVVIFPCRTHYRPSSVKCRGVSNDNNHFISHVASQKITGTELHYKHTQADDWRAAMVHKTDQQFLLIYYGPHHYAQHSIRPIVTVLVWSVFLLVTSASPAKMAEPIKLPFGVNSSRMGPRNHMLGWAGSTQGNGHFWGSYLVMTRLASSRHFQACLLRGRCDVAPGCQPTAATSLQRNTISTVEYDRPLY